MTDRNVYPRAVDEQDYVEAQQWAFEEIGVWFSLDQIKRGIEKVAKMHPYDPLLEELAPK